MFPNKSEYIYAYIQKLPNIERNSYGKVEKAILWSSGLNAGDALIGIIIAIFAFRNINIAVFADNPLATSDLLSLLMFIGLAFVTYLYVRGNKRST